MHRETPSCRSVWSAAFSIQYLHLHAYLHTYLQNTCILEHAFLRMYVCQSCMLLFIHTLNRCVIYLGGDPIRYLW